MRRDSSRPRIIMLGPFPPSLGGISTNIQNLVNSPLKEKYKFLLFHIGSKKFGNRGYFDEKLVTKLWSNASKFFYYIIFLCNNRPDIVHINTSLEPFSFWRDFSFLLISKLFGIKVILQIHGEVLSGFLKKNLVSLKFFIIKFLEIPDQTIVLFSVQKEVYRKIGIKKKMRVVPNMLDVYKYHKNGNFREKHNIPQDYLVILFVASIFFKGKGVWEILESISIITNKYKRINFVFVGGGKEEDAMKRYCAEKGLQDYVKFTGSLSGDETIEIFCESDIFILPSYTEGFPLVILEAMAAGLPVISTPVGAIPEIIDEGVNGFLVPPRDSKKLAEKMTLLIEDQQLRETMARNNKQKVREKYDLRPVSRIFDEIYQGLI